MLVKNEMSFNDLKQNCWSGALYTLEKIEELDKVDEFMDLLEQVFCVNINDSYIPTMTEVNDFLWFNDSEIYDMLGIEEDDE